VQLARNVGIVPVRLLNDMSNDAKLVSFSSWPGIEPLKELCDRFMSVSILSRCPNDSGMSPVKSWKTCL
jgi:hypothetical protein